MKTRAVITRIALVMALSAPAGAALAAHANPWAEADDEVNAQYHDENQARSIDTPGEDEMNGAMTRNAHGKLDGPADGGAGAGNTGNGGGNGGGGNGGGGNGGGGNGGRD